MKKRYSFILLLIALVLGSLSTNAQSLTMCQSQNGEATYQLSTKDIVMYLDNKGRVIGFEFICDGNISYDHNGNIENTGKSTIGYDIKGRLETIGSTKIVYDIKDRVEKLNDVKISYDSNSGNISDIDAKEFGSDHPNTDGLIICINQEGKVTYQISTTEMQIFFTEKGDILGFEFTLDGDIAYDNNSKISKIGDTPVLYDLKQRIEGLGNTKLTYDNKNRIEQVGNVKIGYTYAGLIETIGSKSFSYAYNSNRLEKIGNISIEYDYKGNISKINDTEGVIHYKPRYMGKGIFRDLDKESMKYFLPHT